MSPSSVSNFSPIVARIRVLWRILQSVRKEVEEKTKKKTPNFWPIVSRKWMERISSNFQKKNSSNLECGLPYLAGTSVATLGSIG